MGSKRKNNSNQVDKNSPEYREKRQKNNNAVKRSRNKSKQKNVEASERVSQLMRENSDLEEINQNMAESLKYLKSILISHNDSVDRLSPRSQALLHEILKEDAPVDVEKIRIIMQELNAT